MSFFIGLGLGLIIGWNFLKQPAWVETQVNKIREKIHF